MISYYDFLKDQLYTTSIWQIYFFFSFLCSISFTTICSFSVLVIYTYNVYIHIIHSYIGFLVYFSSGVLWVTYLRVAFLQEGCYLFRDMLFFAHGSYFFLKNLLQKLFITTRAGCIITIYI